MSTETPGMRDSSRDDEISASERKKLEAENAKERKDALAILTGDSEDDDLDDIDLDLDDESDDENDDHEDDGDDQDDDANDDDQENAEGDQDDGEEDDEDDSGEDDEEDDESDSNDDEDDNSDDSVSEDEAKLIRQEEDDKAFAKKLDKGTKKRFSRLLRQRSEAREEISQLKTDMDVKTSWSGYGQKIAEFSKNAGMSDADLSNWLERGAELNRQPSKEAIGQKLSQWATEYGYQAPVAKEADLAPVREKLTSMMRNFEQLDDVSLKEIFGLMNTAVEGAKATPPTAPAPAENTQNNLPPARNQNDDNQSRFSAAQEQQGSDALNQAMGSARQRLGAKVYDRILPKVNKRLAKYAGTNPTMWGELFDDQLAIEERKLSRRKPSKKKPSKTVRSKNSSHSDTSQKEKGEGMTDRQKAIADLTGELPSR